jgi:hypothetical protein
MLGRLVAQLLPNCHRPTLSATITGLSCVYHAANWPCCVTQSQH